MEVLDSVFQFAKGKGWPGSSRLYCWRRTHKLTDVVEKILIEQDITNVLVALF